MCACTRHIALLVLSLLLPAMPAAAQDVTPAPIKRGVGCVVIEDSPYRTPFNRPIRIVTVIGGTADGTPWRERAEDVMAQLEAKTHYYPIILHDLIIHPDIPPGLFVTSVTSETLRTKGNKPVERLKIAGRSFKSFDSFERCDPVALPDTGPETRPVPENRPSPEISAPDEPESIDL